MLHIPFQPSRESAIQTLEAFLPKAAAYGANRNLDPGPEADDFPTSRLSPYLRIRLIDEASVLKAVLSQHSASRVEKFLQEVLWRTYWKGWLEMRPMAWTDWIQQLSVDQAGAGATALEKARTGSTGIDCFDAWVSELCGEGYLHNHTRMWFASIWIFTLGLPWSLGAAFFEEHLLDGDPAANLLSWKWVAGLQTPGKHYLARAANIERYTGGRWNPVGRLNESAPSLSGYREFPKRPFAPPTVPVGESLARPIGYLCHPEDLGTSLDPSHRPDHVAWGWTRAAEVPVALDPSVRRFRETALEKTAREIAALYGIQVDRLQTDRQPFEEAVLDWVRSNHIRTVLTPFAPIGGWQRVLHSVGQLLREAGIEWVILTRDWDRSLYPHATHGFFRFRKTIPAIVESLET